MSRKIKLHIFSGWATHHLRHRTTTWGQMQTSGAWTLVKSINIFSGSANTFAMHGHGLQRNNHPACRALAKWLKHSSKDSTEMVDKVLLAWQAISDRRLVILNTTRRFLELECQTMSEFDKCTLFFSSRNCCRGQLRSLNFEIWLRWRDSRDYHICGNKIKLRTLA